MNKAYTAEIYIQATRKMTVVARNRTEAIELASAKALTRYGDEFIGILSVPFLEGDEE